MWYRLFGWWYRWQACKMAAQVMQSKGIGTDAEGICPKLWSCTVFFESYMTSGADETHADFGPKEPEPLRVISQ
ncbi:MAG: hypothetical protein KGL39_04665 [Patescibacteria group bacterium]|nr:hypothetical protein [Patescibacteria group bacterium]